MFNPLKSRIQETSANLRYRFNKPGFKSFKNGDKKRRMRKNKKYVPHEVFRVERKAFEEFQKENRDYRYSTDYLFFIEDYMKKTTLLGTTCTLFVFEEYLKSLQYATFIFPDHKAKLFSKGEEMVNWLIKTKRKGNNTLLHEMIILMRKTDTIREPDYFLQFMKKMKINKPSFKVSSSLLTSYTSTAAKSTTGTKYVKYAEKAFLNMLSNFKFVQVYLYNAMLNMYTKTSNSEKVWEIYEMMKKEGGAKHLSLLNVYTYGSILETCLYVDKNPKKGLLFYEDFKKRQFDPLNKHYNYVHDLGKKLEDLKKKQEVFE